MFIQQEIISSRRSLTALVALLAITAGAVFMPQPALAMDECCTIVSVDYKQGRVTAQHLATGHTKQFTVRSRQLLNQLKPGMTYGPTQVSGPKIAPGALEPTWIEDCCNFAPTLKGNVGR